MYKKLTAILFVSLIIIINLVSFVGNHYHDDNKDNQIYHNHTIELGNDFEISLPIHNHSQQPIINIDSIHYTIQKIIENVLNSNKNNTYSTNLYLISSTQLFQSMNVFRHDYHTFTFMQELTCHLFSNPPPSIS